MDEVNLPQKSAESMVPYGCLARQDPRLQGRAPGFRVGGITGKAQNLDKIGTRQGQDKDKTAKRQGQKSK